MEPKTRGALGKPSVPELHSCCLCGFVLGQSCSSLLEDEWEDGDLVLTVLSSREVWRAGVKTKAAVCKAVLTVRPVPLDWTSVLWGLGGLLVYSSLTGMSVCQLSCQSCGPLPVLL